MKTSFIDIAMKALQKRSSGLPTSCPSKGRISNNISAVIKLWKRIKHLKNPEDGDSTFPEMSVEPVLHGT
jgi:hypothetical protein